MITELTGKSYIHFKNVYDPTIFDMPAVITTCQYPKEMINPDPNNLFARLTLSNIVQPYTEAPSVKLPQPNLLDQLISYNIKTHLYYPDMLLQKTDLIIWPEISNLSSDEIIDIIEKFQMSDSKYVLLPTTPTLKYNANKQINFQLKPYNFCPPETIIRHDKETFGLWLLDNIKL